MRNLLLVFLVCLSCDSAESPVQETQEELSSKSTKSEEKTDELVIENQVNGEEIIEQTNQIAKLNNLDCVDPDLSKVHTSVQFMNCAGQLVQGTYVEPVPPAPPNLSNLTPENVKSGVTIAGVVGSYQVEEIPLCDGLGQLGCKTNGNWKSMSFDNMYCDHNGDRNCMIESTSEYRSYKQDATGIHVANIKAGLEIQYDGPWPGKIVGTYPSAGNPLTGSTPVTDLTLANFEELLSSSEAFEWFDSAGNRYTRTGDTNLAVENIKEDVGVFGLVGELVPRTDDLLFDPWHLKKGVTVNGIEGKAQVKCRNSEAGAPASEKCGVETWEDLSVTADGQLSPCTEGNPDVVSSGCKIRNRITGHIVYAVGTNIPYSNAVNICNAITKPMPTWDEENEEWMDPVPELTNWRVPTFEELQLLSMHSLGSGAGSGKMWTPLGVSRTVWALGNRYVNLLNGAGKGSTGLSTDAGDRYGLVCVHD